MRMKPLVKFQIAVLIALTILVVWRARVSPVQFDGVVAVSRIDEGSLIERHFRVDDAAVTTVVSATGAYENDERNARPAAYLWILDRQSGDVVWSMLGGRVKRDKVLMSVTDTTSLKPGTYTALFTAMGPTSGSRRGGSILGLKPHWTNDTNPFGFSISVASDSEGRISIVDGAQAAQSGQEDLFWDVSRLGNRQRETTMFRAVNDVELVVRAQLEICSDECDSAAIERLADGRTVWSLSEADASTAGGGSKNMRFAGGVDLPPGIYRAVVETDGGHALGHWRFNPPHNPYFWGVTLAVQSGQVEGIDPWADHRPVISLLRVGDDENRQARIQVADTVVAFVAGMGEIWSSGTRYDYGWLEKESTGERVWEMTWETTEPAGGDRTNRKSEQILTLTPGSYLLYYQSDDSHSHEDWLRTRPTNPARWGAALFVLGSEEDVDAVEVIQRTGDTNTETDVDSDVSVSVPVDEGRVLVDYSRVGNDADLRTGFTLDEESELRITGAGEISTNGRYDYGWIENAETGENVWEMTLRNTEHAGGEARTRRFSGRLTLPAGNYTVRYVSDFDFAYGDFGDGAPNRPEEWGIRVHLLESVNVGQ